MMWFWLILAAYIAFAVVDARRTRRLRRQIDTLIEHKARLRATLIWLGMSIADLDTIAPWLTPDGKPLEPIMDIGPPIVVVPMSSVADDTGDANETNEGDSLDSLDPGVN